MFIQRINEREPFVIVRSYRTRLLPADQNSDASTTKVATDYQVKQWP